MAFQWWRRAAVLAAGAASLLLAACGSGNIESQFNPTRIVSFGDGFADLGQNGARYTVNDGTFNNWTTVLAASYSLTLSSSAAGGNSFATGNARVTAKPDAAGVATTPTVTEQIDRFLAGGGQFTATDLVIVNAGVADVVTQGVAVVAGRQTRAQAITATEQAGRELGLQVRRIVQAGAKHVLVVGPYNLERAPWTIAASSTALMRDVSGRFNEEMLVAMVELGANVLYVDASFFFNLMSSSPAGYSLTNSVAAVCTSVDAGAGIGTGAGQVNSNLCTASTILAGVDYETYLFADGIYPTPRGHRLFGEYAYARVRDRW